MQLQLKTFTICMLFIVTFSFAQTGIGTSTPHASAKLDVTSTNKGFLPPRVTLTSATDATTIPSPAEGLLVYNLGAVGLQAGYYYWNGANWATIATGTTAGNAVVAYDMVKLYSEVYSNALTKIAHPNGYSFTVPVSGRYLFDFSSTGYINQASFTFTFSVRQGTTVLASDFQTSANNNIHVEYNGKLEVNLQSGISYNVYVNTTGNRDSGDYDRVYYKMVAGNLPVNQHVADRNIQLNNNFLSNDGDNEGIRIDNSGNVGIGTATHNTSAILDINSSSKGVLPPKVVLTGRNGTSSPIASPTSGLFVYNTAEAGTASNSVSPGFYFYNGTNWTRMDPEDWATPVSITIDAVTTAPTKGTIVYDKVSYRRTSTTSFEVTYNYSQSTAGTAGSGNYLFSLPGNLTFGSSVLKTTSSSYETIVNRAIIGNGYYGDTSGRLRQIGIIPYDNNRFRIIVMDNTSSGLIVGSSDLGLNTDGTSYKFSFILETN